MKPGDDFFAHVNGSWLDTFAIPADKASYGVAEKLDDEARANVRQIIEDAAKAKAASGSIEQKIGDFYGSFMDAPGHDEVHPVDRAPLPEGLRQLGCLDHRIHERHRMASGSSLRRPCG